MSLPNDKKALATSPLRAKWLAFAKNIKPWNIFFLQKNNYSLPTEKIPMERIKANLVVFQANYIIILVPILILGLYSKQKN